MVNSPSPLPCPHGLWMAPFQHSLWTAPKFKRQHRLCTNYVDDQCRIGMSKSCQRHLCMTPNVKWFNEDISFLGFIWETYFWILTFFKTYFSKLPNYVYTKVDSLTRLIISTLLNAFRLLTLLLFNENIVCLFRLFFFQNQRAYEMYFRI